jgi:membrane-bound serine protease (ClpP class)
MGGMELTIALLGLALVFFVAEAHVPGGVFGILGTATLVGAGFAYREDGHDLPIAVIVTTSLVLGAFFVIAGKKVLAAHRDEPVRTGWEQMVGSVGEVREPLDPAGQVFVDGALWRARLDDGTEVGLGNRVRVKSVDGLTLVVEQVAGEEQIEKGA